MSTKSVKVPPISTPTLSAIRHPGSLEPVDLLRRAGCNEAFAEVVAHKLRVTVLRRPLAAAAAVVEGDPVSGLQPHPLGCVQWARLR